MSRVVVVFLYGLVGCGYVTARGDVGYNQRIAGRSTAAGGGLLGTAAVGGAVFNRHARAAVTIDYTTRSETDALMLAVEGDLLIRRCCANLYMHNQGPTENSEGGTSIIGRLSFGPAFDDDASTIGEATLGVGLIGDSVIEDRTANTLRTYFAGLAVEAVVTRESLAQWPYGVVWMGGLRLSATLPGDLINYVVDGER